MPNVYREVMALFGISLLPNMLGVQNLPNAGDVHGNRTPPK